MAEKFRDSQWDKHGILEEILSYVKIPPMVRAAQQFENEYITDIPAAIAKEFAKSETRETIRPGMTIAVSAGSRGISDIAIILKETIDQLKKLGARPFIFPAMGSHGGATAEGQLKILEDYGITEKSMGVPIRASMETAIIGQDRNNNDVHVDLHAHKADGIVILNRIKPHTAFRNKYESGLLKMLAIGLGKQKGAESCHYDGWGKMAEKIESYADVILKKENILFGIALAENAFDKICHIEAVQPNQFKEREAALLEMAKALMPRIYISEFDILVVGQIGKNFSGDGADPNITATYATPYASGGPVFQKYVILDISDESHGNAVGIGMADFSTKRLFDKIDFDATYPNTITSLVPAISDIPMIMKNDKMAIQAAIHCCPGINKQKPRIVMIKNSSHIGEILISEALAEEAGKQAQMRLLGKPEELLFDAEGNINILSL